MRLSSLKIENYRQFKETQIDFNDELTIIAGANNSGKTSLVELFTKLFDFNSKFYIEDLSASEITKAGKQILKIIEDNTNDEGDGKDFDTGLLSSVNFPSISVELEITYNDGDIITLYSDYLIELREDIDAFFFLSETYIDSQKLIENMSVQVKHLTSKMKDNTSQRNLLKTLYQVFNDSLKTRYYYCNSRFDKDERNVLSENKFAELFNFKTINANRELDDQETDKSFAVSKEMVKLLSSDPNDDACQKWQNCLIETERFLREQFMGNNSVFDNLTTLSTTEINSKLKSLFETADDNIGQIAMETHVRERDIKNLLANILKTEYAFEEYQLDEGTQGLGFSNLVLIHTILQRFKSTIEEEKTNIFLIEEPEAHMHPQMQRVLLNFFQEYCDEAKNLQGLITTHSTEIIKSSSIDDMRVIRTTYDATNEKSVKDMRTFMSEIKDVKQKNLYSHLFEINFADIIFANKCILYEGDTEKLFIQKAFNTERWKKLENEYISFIQVGGAYVHHYKDLIEFLGIKSLIITDIDYAKSAGNIEDIESSGSSNAGLNRFFLNSSKSEKSPSIKEIYEWEQSDNLVRVAYQSVKDGYARTIEDSIIAKLTDAENVFDKKKGDEWNRLFEQLDLQIPNYVGDNKENRYSCRDVAEKISTNSKTDFVYSLILSDRLNFQDAIPNYIDEGLRWLRN